MTDPGLRRNVEIGEPLTDGELDAFAEEIAKARESNRLRDLLSAAASALADDRDIEALGILRSNEDPAARAKRQLGEWLTSGDPLKPRSHRIYPPDPTSSGRFREMWTVKLTEGGTDVGIGDRRDEHEAIFAALAEARKAER